MRPEFIITTRDCIIDYYHYAVKHHAFGPFYYMINKFHTFDEAEEWLSRNAERYADCPVGYDATGSRIN